MTKVQKERILRAIKKQRVFLGEFKRGKCHLWIQQNVGSYYQLFNCLDAKKIHPEK